MRQRRAVTVGAAVVAALLLAAGAWSIAGTSTETDVDVSCRSASIDGTPTDCEDIESILPDEPTVVPDDDN